MKVEVLYFPDCPNHKPALDRVRAVLEEEAAAAEVVPIEVKDVVSAQTIGFLGSPSIRINGNDVEQAARGTGGFGLVCRTYLDGDQRSGVPPWEWLRAAVREAKGK